MSLAMISLPETKVGDLMTPPQSQLPRPFSSRMRYSRRTSNRFTNESPSVLPPPFTSPSSAALSSPSSDLHWIPSRLPFRCSKVQMRGGPLLQLVNIDCTRVYMDLTRGTITLHLKWTDHTTNTNSNSNQDSNESASSNTASPIAAQSTPTESGSTSGKKRARIEEDDDDNDNDPGESKEHDSLVPHNDAVTSLPSSLNYQLPEQAPSKRTRTDERRLIYSHSFRPSNGSSSARSRTHSHRTPAKSFMSVGSSFNHGNNSFARYHETPSEHRSVWTIPLSSVVGVDFAISLDSPGTCTFALKPQSVYSNDTHTTNQRRASATFENLPIYSPARIIMHSYQHASVLHPQRFARFARFVQRVMPPLLYWIWLHSTSISCIFLTIGWLLIYTRFWLSGSLCLIVYLILLIQEFFRSQEEFKQRLTINRQPMEECMYVHLVFAHDAYTSFLSFRRLFVAAAPAFSAPSASSTAPSVIIDDSMPSGLLFGTPASPVPERYPISHLQHILPTSPLFFGSVWVDFICYLLLAPQIFASARVRSLTHFLLPLLYLGQAMVAATRAFSPVAIQGFLWLEPYLLIEYQWFLSILNSMPNPITYILEFLLPLHWIRHVFGSWVIDLAEFSWRSWSYTLSWFYTLFTPIRWLNAFISPMLEFIRQEMRALWGLSVLFQPVVAVLLRLQVEFLRVWVAFSSFARMMSTMFAGMLPTRIFALFSAMRSGASASVVVGSGISASGGISRWRTMYQQSIEFFQMIGRFKLVIDRIRLNIQLWYWERFVHVKDARNLNLQGEEITTTLDVPLVPAIERTQSELSEAEQRALAAAESNSPSARMDSRSSVLLLTPRRAILNNTPALVSPRPSPPSSAKRPNLTASLPTSPATSPAPPNPSSSSITLPTPPSFRLSPLASEPPILPQFSGFDDGYDEILPPPAASSEEKKDATGHYELTPIPERSLSDSWEAQQAELRKRTPHHHTEQTSHDVDPTWPA